MRTDLPDPATATHIALAAVIMLSAGTALQSQAADGLQWSIQPQGVGTAADAEWRLAYGNGRLVAVSWADTYLWDESGAWKLVDSRGGHDVAFGKGRFVAVNGYPRTYSEDGVLWLLSPDIPPNAATVVVYGRGRFVSAGIDAGSEIEMLATSELGEHWAILPSDLDVNPRAPGVLAFGKGKFVLSDHLTLRTSMNLTDWPLTYLQGLGVSHSIRSVAFGGGLFVAAGERGGGPDGEGLLTSADGMRWTLHEYAHNEAPRRGLCYGNGLFAGGGPDGTLYTSSDGLNWTVTKLDTSSEFEDVVFADGRFAAVARDGTFALSEPMPPHVAEIRFRVRDSFRLEDGAMLLTVKGPYGKPSVVEASEDLVNWERIATDPCDRGEFEVYDEAATGLPQRFYRAHPAPPEPPPGPLEQWTLADTVLEEGQTMDWKLEYGHGVLVAAGKKYDNTSGSAWYSEDGLTWQRSNSTKPHENLAFGAGRFVSWAGELPLSTIDGQGWTEHEPVGVVVERQMVFGRAQFSCVAPGPIDQDGYNRTWFVRSADGIQWMTNMIPLLPVLQETQGVYGRSVAYARGRVVFRDSFKIVSSADGQNWDVGPWYQPDGPAGAPPVLDYMFYGKGHFVASGYQTTGSNAGALLFTSEDGVTWVKEEYRSPQPTLATYANGTFVGVSWNSSKKLNQMYGSADGLTWTNLVEIHTGTLPSDLLFAEGRFYLVTRGGEVWHSGLMPPHVTEPRVIPELTYRLPDGAMLVTVEAPYGHEVVVEGSEDLETWQEIGRDPCDRGEFEIYHETAPPGTDWFYRARQVEP